MFERLAFTLAEVLITLGIIGVVAALTLPGLIQKYQEQAAISNLKKAYSMLSQAYRRAIEEYGPVSDWCTDSEKQTLECSYKSYDILGRYIKGDLVQGKYNYGVYKRRDGSIFTQFGEKNPNAHYSQPTIPFGLHNGMYVWISMNSNPLGCCTDTQDTTRNRWGCECGKLLVDLNGSESKPNIDGVDLFGFKIFTDGISPQGTRYDNYWYPYTFEDQCAGNQITSSGRGMCTAWVLENNNLDYLRCPKELGWTKAVSCSK